MGARALTVRAATWAFFGVLSFVQLPGRTTFDTKLDLTDDPLAFLGRALHLWNPDGSFGELQNQAYGYLFPQGAWFAGADVLGVPDWVAQRLWTALLLVLAYEGARGLARALSLSSTAAVLAGLSYALAPRLFGAVGVLTGELLPATFLPWMCWPLVACLRGRVPPVTAGLLSGVAVLCMSGVNATGTIAVLPAALVLLATGLRHRTGRLLAAWWAVGCLAASLWWLGPLLLLGRYSPPFLDYIETAAATTSTTAWANSVRGADHWVAYYAVDGQPWWPAAHTLVTTGPLVVFAGVVAALGCYGLTRRDMPAGRLLGAIALVGLLCLVAGSAARAGSLVDPFVRDLLDGPLAPLRNVHKVDPLVRLPLALGVGHGAVALAAAFRSRFRDRPDVAGPGARGILVLAATFVLVGASPAVGAGMRTPGWEAKPAAWTETATYLQEQPGSRALVVPGAGFGLQTWGWTIDEPLQGEGASWVSRSQVPLTPGPTARVLDGLEQRFASGVGLAGLGDYLARIGVTHVVLRRDLDPALSGGADPDRTEHTLATSAGIERVARFGDSGVPGRALIDVWEVEGAAAAAAAARVTEGGATELSGAPEDVLGLVDAGIVATDDPVALTGEPGEGGVVTDGYVRRERQFGRVHRAVGQTMAADDAERDGRRETDYAGAPGVPLATTEYVAGASVTASSSRGYVDVLGPVDPRRGPAAAVDADESTWWESDPLRPAEGQWLDVDLDAPSRGGVVEVAFLTGPGDGLREVERARLVVDGSAEVYGVPADGRLRVVLPAFRTLRVEVVQASASTAETGSVGVREVTLPGIAPGRTRVLATPVGASTTVLLQQPPVTRACVQLDWGLTCDEDAVLLPESATMDRTFTTTEPGSWRLRGTVSPRPGPAAARLLDPVGGAATVVADSVYAEDPLAAGVFAHDGDPDTAWRSEPGAEEATLTFTWPGRRTLTSVTALGAATGGLPDVVTLRTADGESRRVPLGLGAAEIEPLAADGGVVVELERSDGLGPMTLAELGLGGVGDLRHAPDPAAVTGATCGLGPDVLVDGVRVPTRVDGTVGDVLAGTPLTWEACGDAVDLRPGTHRVVAAPTAQFLATTLAWTPVGGAASSGAASATTATTTARPATVDARDRTSWEIAVGAGDESVLALPMNANPGWSATLDGRDLDRVAVDGWRQGFVVPAGVDGRVLVEFAPDRAYRLFLVGGGLAAGVLLLAAATAVGRRWPGSGRDLLLVVDGPVPLPEHRPVRAPAHLRARRTPPPLAAVVVLAVTVAGGLVAAAGLVLGYRWPGERARWAAVALVGASGVASALAERAAYPGLASDGLAALGVGWLVGIVLVRGRGRGGGG